MKAICFNAECAKDTEEGLNLGKGAVSRRAMFFTTELLKTLRKAKSQLNHGYHKSDNNCLAPRPKDAEKAFGI